MKTITGIRTNKSTLVIIMERENIQDSFSLLHYKQIFRKKQHFANMYYKMHLSTCKSIIFKQIVRTCSLSENLILIFGGKY